MTQKIGIIYSSVNGQTLKICKKLHLFFYKKGYSVTIYNIGYFNEEITKFNLLIIGASVRYGKHNDKVIQFVINNKIHFSKITTAFFSVNLVARKPTKNTPETNPYVLKFLEKTNWKPSFTDVFAGTLNYKLYSLTDKLLIKFIMLITNGPLTSKQPIEFTNWQRINDFGDKMIKPLNENY